MRGNRERPMHDRHKISASFGMPMDDGTRIFGYEGIDWFTQGAFGIFGISKG